MHNSRTENSVLIMLTSSVRQILTLLLTFVSRTVFIKVLGAEYLGLNGLFSNILSLLALSELGIGTAISFYLYKPLVDKDFERIKLLMRFYKICYRVVGIAMIGIGCCLIPLLPSVVKFDQNFHINLYIVYIIYLFNIASSYLFFAYKQALITANQEQYKIEKINIIFTFINCIMDIVVLILFKNYILYLLMKLILVIIKNIIIALKIDSEYPFLKDHNTERLSKNEMKLFFKNIWDASLFRIGSTLFNATDNIIISSLLGTIVVGYYSNYFMLISQITIIFGLITKSFAAGIGNVMAKESRIHQYIIYKKLNFYTYCVTTIFTVCLYQLLNSFIRLWVGSINSNFILSQVVVGILCINFYFDCSTQIMNTFREASGNFTTGKYLQIIGGCVNIVLSLILGHYFLLEGIFAATIISKALITVTPFVINVGRDVFTKEPTEFLGNYIKQAIVTIGIAVILWLTCQKVHMTNFVGFIFECIMSILLPILILLLVYWRKSEMKALRKKITFIFNKNIG